MGRISIDHLRIYGLFPDGDRPVAGRFDVIEQEFPGLFDEPFRQAGVEFLVEDEQVDVIGHDRELFDDGNLVVPLHGLEGPRRRHAPGGRPPDVLSLIAQDFPQCFFLLIRTKGDELAPGNGREGFPPCRKGEKRSVIHGQHLRKNKTFKTRCVLRLLYPGNMKVTLKNQGP